MAIIFPKIKKISGDWGLPPDLYCFRWGEVGASTPLFVIHLS